MCSWPGDSAYAPSKAKRGRTQRVQPALAATALVTNLSAGLGPSRSRAVPPKVEAIVVHHLVPRSHEVTHELLLRVLLCVNLGEGSELGVRAEDEVDVGAGPLHRAGGAIATLVHVLVRTGWLPLRAHVEQVHEEVIGQRPRPLGQDAVLGLPGVSIQGTHAAD